MMRFDDDSANEILKASTFIGSKSSLANET